MKKKPDYTKVAFVAAVVLGTAVNRPVRAEPSSNVEHNASNSAPSSQFWFPVGEKLFYRLYWGIIPVGSAELSTAWTNMNGRALLALRVTAKTGPIVATIYPVEDFIESIVDPGTFLPVEYTQRLREGRHRRHDYTVFYHSGGVARWVSKRTGKTRDIPIDRDTRDALCLMYYMRAKGLDVGESARFRVLVDNKLYDLTVRGVGYENIELEDKKIRCLKVEPQARFGEIFVRKGRVWLWFSADPKHLCVYATGKVPVASVKAHLYKIEGYDDKAANAPDEPEKTGAETRNDGK